MLSHKTLFLSICYWLAIVWFGGVQALTLQYCAYWCEPSWHCPFDPCEVSDSSRESPDSGCRSRRSVAWVVAFWDSTAAGLGWSWSSNRRSSLIRSTRRSLSLSLIRNCRRMAYPTRLSLLSLCLKNDFKNIRSRTHHPVDTLTVVITFFVTRVVVCDSSSAADVGHLGGITASPPREHPVIQTHHA